MLTPGWRGVPPPEPVKPFRVIGLRIEDDEGLVYELPVMTKFHEGLETNDQVHINLSVALRSVVRALKEQAPIPPGFADDTAAQAWLDRYPVQT